MYLLLASFSMHILRKVGTGGLQKETAAQAPNQVILLPGVGHWDRWGAGKVGNCSKKTAKSSQLLCRHHLSKRRTCVHGTYCS